MARTPISIDTQQLQPRILICSDCREEFVFTVSAQKYFADRGIPDDPLRCKSCHIQMQTELRGETLRELPSA